MSEQGGRVDVGWDVAGILGCGQKSSPNGKWQDQTETKPPFSWFIKYHQAFNMWQSQVDVGPKAQQKFSSSSSHFLPRGRHTGNTVPRNLWDTSKAPAHSSDHWREEAGKISGLSEPWFLPFVAIIEKHKNMHRSQDSTSTLINLHCLLLPREQSSKIAHVLPVSQYTAHC